MFENMKEEKARGKILELVKEYCESYHNKKEYQRSFFLLISLFAVSS